MLQQLCELVYNASFELRKNNKEADGLAFWKPIKSILQNYDNSHDEKITWNEPKTIDGVKYYGDFDIDYIMSLNEYDSNNDINEIIHFQKQLVRIPNDKVCLRKIIQIALNKGQYDGTLYKEVPCFKKIFCCIKETKNYGFNVSIYIDEIKFIENNIIEKIIDDINKII